MTDAELDVLVAEKIMGWRREGKEYHTRPEHRKSKDFPGRILNDYSAKGQHDYLIPPTGTMWEDRVAFCGCESTAEVPPYSISMDAAWDVVEKMREKGFVIFELSIDGTDDWTSVFSKTWPTSQMLELSPSASKSICLAALKAVGVEAA